MSVYRNKCKYQLISPIVGTRVYQTATLKKGAKKCYDELQSLNNINTSYFTVLNIDTFETYRYRIDAKNINTNKTNHNNHNKNHNNKNNDQNNDNKNNIDHSIDIDVLKKIDIIQDSINKLFSRIKILEDLLPRDYNNKTIDQEIPYSNNKTVDQEIPYSNNKTVDQEIPYSNNFINMIHTDKKDNIIVGNDDIMAEAISNNISNINMKKLNNIQILNDNFYTGNKTIEDFNQNTENCIIV